MGQLENWSCCQTCGRVRQRGQKDWIDAPYRKPGRGAKTYEGETIDFIRVVRCPDHWSDWALQHSIGRTKANREKMAELKKNAPHFKIPARVEPFPAKDVPPPAVRKVRKPKPQEAPVEKPSLRIPQPGPGQIEDTSCE